MKFNKNSFYWKDLTGYPKKKEKENITKVEKTVEILNSLTEEQQEAVEFYAYSRWKEGNADGYDSGYGDGNCEDY
jgi:hypothetical protein